MFKQDADYPFVDWSFSGTTEEEFATLMAIFKAEDKEVYIADYEHLGVYACRIIVPGMSDIYPAEDLWLANNSMGAHLRDTILSLPGSEWDKEDYLALIEQMDDEGLDDFTRVRELLGLATGKDNGWYTLRVGELKAMLALAGGDLEQALIWTEWTMEFNASVFSAERANYYRCLQTLLLLSQEEERQPLQYLNAFIRMYGADAVEAFFKAYFVDGRDLSDASVLAELAQAVGLSAQDTAEVLQDSALHQAIADQDSESRELGISGVPFFIFNRKKAVNGAQGSARLLEVMNDVLFSEA